MTHIHYTLYTTFQVFLVLSHKPPPVKQANHRPQKRARLSAPSRLSHKPPENNNPNRPKNTTNAPFTLTTSKKKPTKSCQNPRRKKKTNKQTKKKTQKSHPWTSFFFPWLSQNCPYSSPGDSRACPRCLPWRFKSLSCF